MEVDDERTICRAIHFIFDYSVKIKTGRLFSFHPNWLINESVSKRISCYRFVWNTFSMGKNSWKSASKVQKPFEQH